MIIFDDDDSKLSGFVSIDFSKKVELMRLDRLRNSNNRSHPDGHMAILLLQLLSTIYRAKQSKWLEGQAMNVGVGCRTLSN